MPKAYNLRLISINSDDISQNFVYNSRYDTTKDNLDFLEMKSNGKIGLKSVVQKLTLQGPRWWGGQIGFNLSHPSAKREKTTFLSRGPPNWPMNTRVFAHSCLSLNQKNSDPVVVDRKLFLFKRAKRATVTDRLKLF